MFLNRRLFAGFVSYAILVHAASVCAEQSIWTLAVIGDQQRPVEHPEWTDRFSSQTDWLAANASDINLRMVSQVGDIVEHAGNLDEWNRASNVMQTLDSAANADGGTGVPWHVAYGNHEIIGVTTNPSIDLAGLGPSANYRQYFGSASGTHRYANQPEFRGVSTNDLNTWHIVHSSSASDARPYLMLNLEIDVPGQKQGVNFDAIEWAQGIIDAHPNMATIVTTHVFEGTKHGPPNNPYLNGFGHNSQIEIFDKLVKINSQIFMVLSGHTSEDSHQIKMNAVGKPVLQMVTDYNKWVGTAGDGFMRLLEIDENANEVRVKTYSPYLDAYRTNSNGQFTYEVDFSTRFTPGSVPNPPLIPAILGHWSLDDGQSNASSTTAVDSIAPAKNGVWQNAVSPRWGPGIAGGAASFGGSGSSADDVITIDGNGKTNVTGALTIAAWIKQDQTGGGISSTRHIAGKDTAGGPSGDAYSLKHTMSGGANKLQFLIGSGGANTNLTSQNVLSTYTQASQNNGWVHVAGTFEPGDSMRLYINGVIDREITGAAVPASIDAIPGTPFTIGRLNNSTQHSFTGAIDDVQLYNHALSLEEIQYLFSNPGDAIPFASSVPGDFNNDGLVDAADYTVWRNNLGSSSSLPNDNGIATPIGTTHYLLWKTHFGQTAPGSNNSLLGVVPEPHASAMIMLAITVGICRRGFFLHATSCL